MRLFGSIKELVSAVFRKDSQEITVRPNQATTYTAARDVQLPPGDTAHVLMSATSTQTITGKTIDGDDNTLQDISISSLKTVLGDADEAIVRDGSGVVVSAKIVNANIDTAAAIDATKIANGAVSNTEFQFLDGVTSGIQGQLDAKVTGPGSATDEALTRFDGTTGKLVQNSVITATDAGIMSGITQLNVDNLRLDGNTVSSTNTDGNISLDPNGTGIVEAVSEIRATGGALRSDTSLILEETGAGTDTITLQAPASIAASYTLTLPPDDGDSGEVLSTNGSGVLDWASAATVPAEGYVYSNGSALATVGDFAGDANKVAGINSAANAPEYKSLLAGTGGTDFAVAHAAGSITYNLPDAGPSARGVVTTGAQSFAGLKTFSGGISSVEFIGTNPEVGGSSPFQLTTSHKRSQTINPAGAITVRLPATAEVGEIWVIRNRSTNLVTVESSGGNELTFAAAASGSAGSASIRTGYVIVQALDATPTTAAEWLVLEAYERGTFTATLSWGTSNGTSTIDSQSNFYERRNRQVWIRGQHAITKGTATGAFGITGLPYMAENASADFYGNGFYDSGYDAATQPLWASTVPANSTILRYRRFNPSGGGASSSVTDGALQGSFTLLYSILYNQ